MNKEMSIEQFKRTIELLPPAYEQGMWIRWLSGYHTPGYYHRKVNKKRSAKFAYNHLANPEMLLWLIRASGVKRSLVKSAEADYERLDNVNEIAGAIREHVPWEVLEPALQQRAKTTTHWLQYWKPHQIQPANTKHWSLNHSAGNQLANVKPGDVVWIISIEHPGRLITLGPIHAEKVVDQEEAHKLVGPIYWDADWHIADTNKNVLSAKRADLRSVISRIRFISKNHLQINSKGGKVSANQFQQMRKLVPESVHLISRLWYLAAWQDELLTDKVSKALDHLDSLDKKQTITIRREQQILRHSLFRSASVMQCGLCGREYPVSLMVVAHIKPRAKCSDLERRDKNNLMPLCLLGCDSLFEHGFISVDEARVVRGPMKVETDDLREKVEVLLGSHCQYWSPQNQGYFVWRAEHSAAMR